MDLPIPLTHYQKIHGEDGTNQSSKARSEKTGHPWADNSFIVIFTILLQVESMIFYVEPYFNTILAQSKWGPFIICNYRNSWERNG